MKREIITLNIYFVSCLMNSSQRLKVSCDNHHFVIYVHHSFFNWIKYMLSLSCPPLRSPARQLQTNELQSNLCKMATNEKGQKWLLAGVGHCIKPSLLTRNNNFWKSSEWTESGRYWRIRLKTELCIANSHL